MSVGVGRSIINSTKDFNQFYCCPVKETKWNAEIKETKIPEKAWMHAIFFFENRTTLFANKANTIKKYLFLFISKHLVRGTEWKWTSNIFIAKSMLGSNLNSVKSKIGIDNRAVQQVANESLQFNMDPVSFILHMHSVFEKKKIKKRDKKETVDEVKLKSHVKKFELCCISNWMY